MERERSGFKLPASRRCLVRRSLGEPLFQVLPSLQILEKNQICCNFRGRLISLQTPNKCVVNVWAGGGPATTTLVVVQNNTNATLCCEFGNV